MFEIGGLELLVILLVALLVLGPSRLPDVAVKLAQGFKKLKAASLAFQRTLMTEVAFQELKNQGGLKKDPRLEDENSLANNLPSNGPNNPTNNLATNRANNASNPANNLLNNIMTQPENKEKAEQPRAEENNDARE